MLSRLLPPRPRPGRRAGGVGLWAARLRPKACTWLGPHGPPRLPTDQVGVLVVNVVFEQVVEVVGTDELIAQVHVRLARHGGVALREIGRASCREGVESGGVG